MTQDMRGSHEYGIKAESDQVVTVRVNGQDQLATAYSPGPPGSSWAERQRGKTVTQVTLPVGQDVTVTGLPPGAPMTTYRVTYQKMSGQSLYDLLTVRLGLDPGQILATTFPGGDIICRLAGDLLAIPPDDWRLAIECLIDDLNRLRDLAPADTTP